MSSRVCMRERWNATSTYLPTCDVYFLWSLVDVVNPSFPLSFQLNALIFWSDLQHHHYHHWIYCLHHHLWYMYHHPTEWWYDIQSYHLEKSLIIDRTHNAHFFFFLPPFKVFVKVTLLPIIPWVIVPFRVLLVTCGCWLLWVDDAGATREECIFKPSLLLLAAVALFDGLADDAVVEDMASRLLLIVNFSFLQANAASPHRLCVWNHWMDTFLSTSNNWIMTMRARTWNIIMLLVRKKPLQVMGVGWRREVVQVDSKKKTPQQGYFLKLVRLDDITT